VGLCDGVQMLQANLSPVNPRTMQLHNCVRQALKAAGVCPFPWEHAREEDKNEVRRRKNIGKPVAQKQQIKSFSMSPAQHKKYHCHMGIYFINYEVPIVKLECPALE